MKNPLRWSRAARGNELLAGSYILRSVFLSPAPVWVTRPLDTPEVQQICRDSKMIHGQVTDNNEDAFFNIGKK
jgi:hypothetical protein